MRDNALRWVSNEEVPNWVELAWDRPQTINAARILSGQAHDPEPSTPIGDFVCCNTATARNGRTCPGAVRRPMTEFDWHATFPAVTARQFRLFVTATPGDLTRIWELELYNRPVKK